MEVKAAVMTWACATHAASIKRDRGWQDRQAAARRTRRRQIKDLTAEASLFDPGPPLDARKPWEDIR